MLVDGLLPADIRETQASARRFEADGFDGAWASEIDHDVWLQLLRASDVTSTLMVGSAVAIAFARTPMTLAQTAYDLHGYSGGRFVLGIGSQVKPHIERRFSMPWSRPAARMHEYVLALQAIWRAWTDDERLSFRGDFYTHDLMTPFFTPARHAHGAPPVYVAGVGPMMTTVAGQVADGYLFHPFTTKGYLEDVTVPVLREARGERGMDGFAICGPAFVCTGRTEEELANSIEQTKGRLAFYASTPAYRPVLDHHGWGDLQPELTAMSKAGRWAELGALIDDEVLRTFAVVGEPAAIAPELHRRWHGVATRLSLLSEVPLPLEITGDLVAELRAS